MDFKSLISKLDSIEAPKETPRAPKLPDAITLNEDATLRVLAGTSTVLKELDMNLIKAAQKGQEGKPMGKPDPESDKNVKKKYGYRMDGEPAERDDDPTKQERRGRKRQNTGESIVEDGVEGVEEAAEPGKADKVVGKGESFNLRAFESKFAKMVEAKKTTKGKKAEEKMDEAKKSSKKKPDADNDGVPDWADKKSGEDDNADKSKDKKETKGLSAKQKKLPAGLQKAIAKKKGKTESVRRSKRVVAEGLEPILKFQDMLKLVQESGGQQQIDPLDKTLFAWATRVARNKLGEGLKAEVYAGMIYERNGGRFEMYDVLAENQK